MFPHLMAAVDISVADSISTRGNNRQGFDLHSEGIQFEFVPEYNLTLGRKRFFYFFRVHYKVAKNVFIVCDVA